MSYESQALLGEDVNFSRRSRSCLIQQAGVFLNDTRLNIVALSNALLKMYPLETATFLNTICAAPGLADKVDNGDGTIDQTQITDGDLLSNVQALYPEVAALFYQDDGTPIAAPS
jgi:hypothetical protein